MESYSFTSLAEILLRRYGGAAVPTLSEAGRAVLVRRAMDEMMDKVVYYGRIMPTPPVRTKISWGNWP